LKNYFIAYRWKEKAEIGRINHSPNFMKTSNIPPIVANNSKKSNIFL